MAKITVTFVEDGDVPASFVIPANIAAKLDQYIADCATPTPDGSVSRYAGKADLFLKHNVETLLNPIIARYPDNDPAILALEAQKKALEAQIAAAKTPILPA